MPLIKRRRLFAARLFTAVSAAFLRGRAQAAALTAHEFLRIAPTLWRNGDWHGPISKRFYPNGREVWLTIDDGPDPQQTPGMLKLLATAGAKVSFFVIGKKVERNRVLCRRIVEEGHTLENHTYSHFAGLFWMLPCCAIRSEIARCNHAIRVAAGVQPGWFRSPAGMTNACVHPAALQSWLRVAGWSADGLDGLPGRDPASIVERIMRRVKPGAIILMHEGNASRKSVETLALLLARLSEQGYRCVIPPAKNII